MKAATAAVLLTLPMSHTVTYPKQDEVMRSADSPCRKKILGYTDRLTVRPGEWIEFKVSVDGGRAYSAQLVRLINGDTCSEAANFKEIEIEATVNGEYQGRQQRITPGSCIVVEDFDRMCPLDELTAIVSLMPTMPRQGTQHVISYWDERARAGWSLHINGNGQLAFAAVDDRRVTSSVVLKKSLTAKIWYTAALRVSWKTKTVRLDCRSIEVARAYTNENDITNESSITNELGESLHISCPLMMAAAFGGRDEGGRVIPTGCFNGRLEAPVLYRCLLSDDELTQAALGRRPSSLSPHLIGDWDFGEITKGTQIRDRSTNCLGSYTHNLPLRAVKGSRWNGSTMEWRHATDQYAAIHFHSDDVHDSGWLTDFKYQVPADMRSGTYALRLRILGELNAVASEDYLPFFVAPKRGAPQAKIAFIAPTFTYMAYGNVRGMEVSRKASGKSPREFYRSWIHGPGWAEYSMLIEEHPELGLSLYNFHADGSPVHVSSWLRPLLNFRPKTALWTFGADLLLMDWLETRGFEYDVITDDLLQEEGVDLLKGYRVVITGNHPEYATTEQLDAIESYLGQGGRLMYMGGNGYYWRIATHKSVIEVRRGRTGTGPWQSEVGESCLSLSGEMGGIWRDLARPPQRLCGVGFIAEGSDASYYRVLPEARRGRAAFILDGVKDDVIGNFGIFGGAAGQEIDRTNASYGTPDGVVVVARSENHGPRMLYVVEEMFSSYPVIDTYRSLTCAEVVFFETRNGGAVFSVGSMAWCGSLSHNDYDNDISTMTANVLARFSS